MARFRRLATACGPTSIGRGLNSAEGLPVLSFDHGAPLLFAWLPLLQKGDEIFRAESTGAFPLAALLAVEQLAG